MDPSSPAPAGAPSTGHVLIAPWIYLFAPARAATVMVMAQAGAFWLMYGLHLLALLALVVLCQLWGAMVYYDGLGGLVYPNGARPHFRTLGETWADSQERAVALRLILPVLAGAVGGALFVTWLNLPRVYRDGSPWQSFVYAHRIVTAAAAGVVLRAVTFAAVLVAIQRERLLGMPYHDYDVILVPSFAMMALALLRWFGLAVDGAPPRALTLPLPPKCEDCGYDLTAPSGGDRCPECGKPIASSLTPGARRRPSSWARSPGAESWWQTSWMILLHPGRFYGGLALRSDDGASNAFARWQLAFLGAAAGVWVAIMFSVEAGPNWRPTDLCFSVCMAGCGTIFLVWMAHRSVGALAATIWAFARTLPDHAWAGRVIAYETVFAWTLCAFSGSLVTSFIVGPPRWITDWLGRPVLFRMLGIPPEQAVLLGGNVMICAFWLLRYRRIAAAIRWSNF